MIVWRIRRNIIRTVLCRVVYDSCTQWYAQAYEQFLKMSVGLGLGLVCVRLFRFSILCVFFWFSLDCLFFLCCVLCCVRFSFFTTKPIDWLGWTSPKWSILCLVAVTQLISGCILWTSQRDELKFGKHLFLFVRPWTSDGLSASLHELDNTETFNCQLKAFLFHQACRYLLYLTISSAEWSYLLQ